MCIIGRNLVVTLLTHLRPDLSKRMGHNERTQQKVYNSSGWVGKAAQTSLIIRKVMRKEGLTEADLREVDVEISGFYLYEARKLIPSRFSSEPRSVKMVE